MKIISELQVKLNHEKAENTKLKKELMGNKNGFGNFNESKMARIIMQLEKKVKELQVANHELTDLINKKVEEYKYQDIEINMLRKKKNEIVNLEVKSLRLTEKNRQLQDKVDRYKNQLSKARSPIKSYVSKDRKESGDSIFSLSPDHSIDEDGGNTKRVF